VDQASVLGGSFKRDAIAGLCADIADIDDVLASLVRLQILRQEASRQSAELGQFKFVQSVVPQVAYATLSRRDRKASHLAVISQFEAEVSAGGDLAPILAQHYLDAIDAVPSDPDVETLKQAAIAHLEKAASRAQSLGSPKEAAAHISAALALAGDTDSRADLERDLAFALIDTGAYEEAIEHAVQAATLFESRGDVVNAGHAVAAQSVALGFLGDNAQALAVAQPHWDAVSGRRDADVAQLALTRAMSSANSRMGINNRDLLERRIKLAEKVGDLGEVANCFTGLSIHYGTVGAISLARVLLEAAAEMSRVNHQPSSLARALLNLTASRMLDDLDKAVDIGHEAVSVATETGVPIWIGYSQINLLIALWTSGRWAEADEILQSGTLREELATVPASVAISGAMSVARGIPWTLTWPDEGSLVSDDSSDLAWKAFAEAIDARQRGDLDAAVRLGVFANEKMYEISGTWDDLCHMWPSAVETALENGDNAAVETLISLIESESGRPVSDGVRIHRKRVAGLVAIRDGEPAEVVESTLREAISEFETWGATPYWARTQVDLGTWLVAQGRAEDAAQLFDSARAAFAKLGASAWMKEIEQQSASR
jgi:tetratricopeptide (TPR) repeat protein